MNQSRQELLQGLYGVREHLQQAANARIRLQAIADKVQSERHLMRAETPRAKLNQLKDSLLIAAMIFGVVGGLLSGQLFVGALCAGILFLICKRFKVERYQDRLRRKKSLFRILLYIIGFPFILMFFMPFVMMVAFLFDSPLRAIASTILTAAVYRLISKKREQANMDIMAYNEETRQINQFLQGEADAAQNKLAFHAREAQRIGSGWYPKSYYNLYAVGCFIQYIENYQADTVKEMVNLFEDSEHKRKMERYQQEILSNQQQALNNQRAIQDQIGFMSLQNMLDNYDLRNTIRDCTASINSNIRAR